jgi:hypothetical protein
MADAFVTQLNFNGTGLQFSTYLGGGIAAVSGGSAVDEGHAITIDASGIYVTGTTASANFPTLNAYQSTYQGGMFPAGDAFVTKLNHGGLSLLYSTYFGGPGYDEGNGIAVNNLGEVHVAGTTAGNLPAVDPIPGSSTGLGTTGGGAFVAKFSASGTAPIYSTSILATSTGRGISLDPAGDAYVTGDTQGVSPR